MTTKVRELESDVGVMFITIEDETGIANLVVSPDLYEKQRRVIFSAGMLAVYGRVQREGDVVHLIAHRLVDLTPELASVGDREVALYMWHGHGDQAKTDGGPDPREATGRKARKIDVSDAILDQIKVKTRNFR